MSVRLPIMSFSIDPTADLERKKKRNVVTNDDEEIKNMVAALEVEEGRNMGSKKLPADVKKAGKFKIVPFPTEKSKIKQRTQMENHIIPTHPSSVIMSGRS